LITWTNKLLSVITSSQKGFTLVELVMGLVMSSIVMTGIYVIVSGSHEYIIKGRTRVNLQRDFSLIRHALATNIRQGIYQQLEIYADYDDYLAAEPTQSSGSCLKLFFPSGDSVLLYKDNSDFKVEQTGGTTTNLVQGVLDMLVFSDESNSIQTALSLTKSSRTIVDTLRHAFRNFTDVTTAGIDTLRPTGSGAQSQNSDVGCSSNWQCVDDATPDEDVTYVKATGKGRWKTDSYETSDGSGSGTIDSVVVHMRVRKTDSSQKARTLVRISGTKYYGTSISLTSSSYTNFSTTYANNPDTSAPWTWSDVDNMEIGVRLYIDEGSGSRCTQLISQRQKTLFA
jgi:prepilin-type N-terminal cleavage/methylation domain-containing protein